ncbi:signal peptidase I [Clostridium sp. ZS2-4]|uniref:signal peptidase I n=1 Tax=Clostridium sp. ZS2-4 TaxID=2987703 RepID=UPI00227D6C42|nr:signal peptidase I [Clostridium sp. ZS2-4]MCY6355735.1 signal peptidase I [Clostridium sp. ZS2-4]
MNEKCKELVQTLVIFLCVICINIFVIGAVRVEGKSMYPTLNNKVDNDRMLVEKISNYTKSYRRGEIIIFKPYEENKDIYVKRIIGVPNDIVEISNGKVYVNGDELKENYLKAGIETYPEIKVTVPENQVFVLGDNRGNSVDSRKIGTISMDNIKGHALYRFNILEFSASKLE